MPVDLSVFARMTPGPYALMQGLPTNVLTQGGLRVARCDFDGDFAHHEAHANAAGFAKVHELVAELASLRARLTAAERLTEFVEELATCGVEFSDPRVRYETVQVAPGIRQRAAEALAAWRTMESET